MEETIIKTKEYLSYIKEHYENVQKAWKLIQTKCDGKMFDFIYDDWKWGLLDVDIKQHDISKLSKTEFVPYRIKFFPTEQEMKNVIANNRAFGLAWEHHKKHNPHHWETWTNSDFKEPYAGMNLVHNVCDWIAMGFKFNDTAKSYYEKNKDRIIMPGWAKDLMYEIFKYVY